MKKKKNILGKIIFFTVSPKTLTNTGSKIDRYVLTFIIEQRKVKINEPDTRHKKHKLRIQTQQKVTKNFPFF